MKVSVYDTYVSKNANTVRHFDILVEESISQEKVHAFGKEYLNQKGITNSKLTTKECSFCHIEIASEHLKKQIISKGYHIIEMENC